MKSAALSGALWLLSALVLCALLLLIFVLAIGGVQTTEYRKYEDAVADNAVRKGWVPEFLPTRATEIVEKHNVEINDIWVEFSFSGGFDDFSRGFDIVPDTRRADVLDVADLSQWWTRRRAKTAVMIQCANGRAGLLLVSAADHRALYIEPVDRNIVTSFRDCSGTE